jgi:hypothetical protein
MNKMKQKVGIWLPEDLIIFDVMATSSSTPERFRYSFKFLIDVI